MNFGCSKINKLGQNRILNTSYLWIFIVPILACFFNKIDVISLPIFGKEHIFVSNLPFSWHAFYFTTLFIALGNICYVIFCPEFIAKYDTLEDYLKTGKSCISLTDDYLRSISYRKNKKSNDKIDNKIKQFMNKYCDCVASAEEDLSIKVCSSNISKEKMGDAFFHVRNNFEKKRKICFNICLTFYSFGIVLFLCVIIHNSYNVIESFSKLFG